MRLIFDQDMFKDAMKQYDIDVKKMPLGKLSKSQIAKGFEVLEELEMVLESRKKVHFKKLHQNFIQLFLMILVDNVLLQLRIVKVYKKNMICLQY